MGIVKRVFSAVERRIVFRLGGEYYLNYLRSKGCHIGVGCLPASPKLLNIDISRPYLIHIGDRVRLNQGLTILTHDFSTLVFKAKYGELLASSGKVTIGNNVYFGRNCTVLKGVSIGDNCIIGYGSLVMKDIPANSVAVGSPARVICSIDEYYEKRRKKSLEEALALAREIKATQHRMPVPSDFREEFVYFVSGDQVNQYPDIPIEYQLRVVNDCYDTWVNNHKAEFPDFKSFLVAAGVMDDERGA